MRVVHDPDQLSQAAQACVSTVKVSAAHLKSGLESCMRGTVSQLHATAAWPLRCVCASTEHWDAQLVEGDRPDTEIVMPTQVSE